MFTPPPSPQPSRTGGFNTSAPIPSTELHNLEITYHSRNIDDTKRRTGRRFLWAVILVPLIVITFTLCVAFSNSLVQTSLVSSPLSNHGFVSDQSIWKREPEPQNSAPSISSTSSASPTSTTASPTAPVPAASQALPTIPSSPPTLPMPFPQAFDGTFTQNFSAPSCLNFFTNMTLSPNFRQCRPFSFLFSTSSTFMKAQTNLTLMNSLIWGTCNTTLSYSQCQTNMASFASSLQTECSQELKLRNPLAVDSLTALHAFQVMHDTACQVDSTSNAYCFLRAVQNSNPSDLYFYSLPLGIPLPEMSTPTCSACSKGVMDKYATALQGSQAALLTGLKSSYQVSAQIAVEFCGAAFAQTSISAAMSFNRGSPTVFMSSIFALMWLILAHIS